MDPSEEKQKQKQPVSKKRSYVLPAVLLLILLFVIGGIYAFLNSSSPPPLVVPEPVIEVTEPTPEPPTVIADQDNTVTPDDAEEVLITAPEETAITDTTLSTSAEVEAENTKTNIQEDQVQTETEEIVKIAPSLIQQPEAITTICTKPTKQLDVFYNHLDKQQYVQAYNLQEGSELHFENLIEKLLDNPPKVTRESDDLYTILRNTAHFFRISGKDNILLLKGILNREKESLEQILADYYFLINSPECIHNKYVRNINDDALYEYACFFLNTMGGRLYLFRRDSQSRMVVTYYAILLVDLANQQQNNRHGIALKPSIDMLISEMETGGSNMKGAEDYLDILYDLKEAYQ